jgi:hypothetical protein
MHHAQMYMISSDLDLPFTINVSSCNPPPFHVLFLSLSLPITLPAYHSPLTQVSHDLLLNLFFISYFVVTGIVLLNVVVAVLLDEVLGVPVCWCTCLRKIRAVSEFRYLSLIPSVC